MVICLSHAYGPGREGSVSGARWALEVDARDVFSRATRMAIIGALRIGSSKGFGPTRKTGWPREKGPLDPVHHNSNANVIDYPKLRQFPRTFASGGLVVPRLLWTEE
jgi:hypothetical protein